MTTIKQIEKEIYTDNVEQTIEELNQLLELGEADFPLDSYIKIICKRSNGSKRIIQWGRHLPSLTEQHHKEVNDINILMSKYTPDEVAQILIAKGRNKQEILGHDFSVEPSLQEAKNSVYQIKKFFDEQPEHIKRNFASAKDFLLFCENPQNIEQLRQWGLAKKQEPQKQAELEKPAQVSTETQDQN